MALNDIPLSGNTVFHVTMYPSVWPNTCAMEDQNIDVLLEKWQELTDQLSNNEHIRRLKVGYKVEWTPQCVYNWQMMSWSKKMNHLLLGYWYNENGLVMQKPGTGVPAWEND